MGKTGTAIAPKVQILNEMGLPMRMTNTPHAAGNRFSQELNSWQPQLQSADSEWLGDRDTVVARVQDISRNDGWAAGALRTKLVNILGAKLNLQSRPDYRALGPDHAWSSDWARDVEGKFRTFAEDPDYRCDIRRMQSLSGMIAVAFLEYMQTGDGIIVAHYLSNSNGYKTTFQTIDPDRLSNPNNAMDSDAIRGGVERTKVGRPVAYNFRNGHPADSFSSRNPYSWERVKSHTKHGRRKVIHYFNHQRSGQTRGKSLFTPILEKLKMSNRLSKTQIQAALLNCVLAAFVESPVDSGLMADIFGEQSGDEGLGAYQQGRSEFHENRAITLNGLKVPQLFPGEKFSFSQANHPGANFAEFEKSVLRNIASGTGLSYEQ
ncbi:MAG: phage portal protein, partial [Sneathiella sp.]